MSSPPPHEEGTTTNHFSCLYFGFASNLSPRSLKGRCPSAMYAGLALLTGWKLFISEVGFGNIVATGDRDDVVYGTLNFISKRDEDALDVSEEVPQWHEKMALKVARLGADGKEILGEVEVTTYVDVKHVTGGVISKEYIPFVRKAVADGLHLGVAAEYFEKYWRRFLPADDSVGQEDQIIMIRTAQVDKHNTGYVPSHMLRSAGGNAS